MPRPMRIEDIGGAKVARKITTAGGRVMVRGEEISLDVLRAMPRGNRDALIENGFLEVWPKNVTFLRPAPSTIAAPAAAAAPGDDDGDAQRLIVPRGFGRYDVVEGHVLAVGITKEEAHAIAGTPVVPQQQSETGDLTPATTRRGVKKRRGGKRKNPKARSHASAPPPPMPDGIKPAEPADQKNDDEPNGPIEQ